MIEVEKWDINLWYEEHQSSLEYSHFINTKWSFIRYFKLYSIEKEWSRDCLEVLLF